MRPTLTQGAAGVIKQPGSSNSRGHQTAGVIKQPGSSNSRGHQTAGVIKQPGSLCGVPSVGFSLWGSLWGSLCGVPSVGFPVGFPLWGSPCGDGLRSTRATERSPLSCDESASTKRPEEEPVGLVMKNM
ncbi:hypothetical protein EYF80_057105 [Liparis tanakae]|uniref:Uncharacterized protein n=1 Tax=Liparis tanakae TaxID=230148 RepID=A0A4Z2EWV7_9TELE|nr:hypothetical protein EYF80_057105 [Liparis tanakae]